MNAKKNNNFCGGRENKKWCPIDQMRIRQKGLWLHTHSPGKQELWGMRRVGKMHRDITSQKTTLRDTHTTSSEDNWLRTRPTEFSECSSEIFYRTKEMTKSRNLLLLIHKMGYLSRLNFDGTNCENIKCLSQVWIAEFARSMHTFM